MSALDIPEQKRRLRHSLVARILGMASETRAEEERALLTRALDLPGLSAAETVLFYASAFPEEIHTDGLLGRLRASGKRMVFPRVDRKAQRLRLFVVDDPVRDFVSGTLNIPEPRAGLLECPPNAVDWALIPGLGFDDHGYRLGRGRGHYDRLLPLLRPDAPRWALALTPQSVPDLPVESHDQPLSGVLFPDRIVRRS